MPDSPTFADLLQHAHCQMVKLTPRRYVVLSMPNSAAAITVNGRQYAVMGADLLYGPDDFFACYVWIRDHFPPIPG